MRRDRLERRELHFIAIGGAGMSGLALVCHQLGARVSGSDRAESSYLRRLREAGLEPRSATTPSWCRQAPRSSSRARSPTTTRSWCARASAASGSIHRGELLAELCALRRLIAVVGHARQDDDRGDAGARPARLGADPAFFLGGELPGAGPTAGPPTPAGGAGEWVVAEADESDASFSSCAPRSR